jgi:hypothetical protein
MQPIIVDKRPDGRLICIEGNTRLYIYRAFVAEGVEGSWTQIPALVHDGLTTMDVDAIRLQAHLVGPRPRDAYFKGKVSLGVAAQGTYASRSHRRILRR